jgi:tetratricopeptide (TPR) repeat protein
VSAETPEPSDRRAARDAELLRELEAAAKAQDWPRAMAMARDALDKGLQHPLTLNLRAFWLEQQGRYDDALRDLQQASRLAPDDASILNAIGLCLSNLGRLDEAAAAFDKTIKVQADFAPAYLNRGLARESLGDLVAARRDYQRAYDLNPQDPEPLSCLATLATRRGDWKEARTLAGRVLATYPQHPAALIAQASADLADGRLAQAEATLTACMANPNVPPLGHARAQALLGDVYDAGDRADEAFAAYTESKLEMKTVYAARFEAPGAETMPQYLDWLTEYFEQAPPDQWGLGEDAAPTGTEPQVHVFLVGFPRSGTTLLENVLASHPDVVTMEERPALVGAAGGLAGTPAGLDRLAALSPAKLAEYRQAYWRQVQNEGIAAAGKVFVDKHPLNGIGLPLVEKFFPRAKVLLASRDPRDTVWSCFRRQFRMNPSTYQFLTLDGAASLYDQVMRLYEIYREKMPLALHVLRYEDLIESFEAQTRAVCSFIGIDWLDDMHDFARQEKARSIATASSVQIGRGLYREGIGQWRRYKAQLAPILPVLKPWVEKCGYPPD